VRVDGVRVKGNNDRQQRGKRNAHLRRCDKIGLSEGVHEKRVRILKSQAF
jgi:hypothetical protein